MITSRIAIITVCRNPGPLLAQAMASVEALRDPRVAYIVVDGASSDGTTEFLRANTARVWRWSSEPDRGIYDAMNKGWNMAPEDSFVLFLGADDRILSLPSASTMARLAADGADIIFGTTTVGTRPFRSRWNRGLLLRNTLHHQSMLVRKAIEPRDPFDAGYRTYGDWDFNLRLWRRGARAMACRELRAHAAPGGASSRRPTAETYRIASTHSGPLLGLSAVAFLWACAVRDAFRKA